MTEILPMVLALSAILFSGVTALFSILSYCKVVGLEKSTHKVEYVAPPMGMSDNPTGKDLLKKFAPEDMEF